MRHLVLPLFSIFALSIALGALLMREPSKEYWQSVGPQWNRMLNPSQSITEH